MSISEFKKSLLLLSEIKIQFLIVGIVVFYPTVVQAQIIPDRTLPNNSTVTNNGDTSEINGGTVRGTNLFHSFNKFSLNPDGLSNGIDTAYFNNGDNITAIFSRITGNSISEINGLIKANGSADLFLINPNGIIFGENASLDLGGSFISSTADSIQFAGVREFNAVNPQANPLLTVNIPVGLQYGKQPQDISVLGSALEVIDNQTLGLIGGNVFVEGGSLTTAQGNIELGAVGSNQTVELNSHSLGWELDYAAVGDFNDISLSEAAKIETMGNSGKKVQLRGDYVSLTEASAIYLHTNDVEDGGNLNIDAQEIELGGVDSGLFSLVGEDAEGNGANINLHTDQLTIFDGAQIALDTLGLGNGGSLNIDAQEINLIDDSGIFAHAIMDIGNGGDIAIVTDTLSIQNGAKIYAGNFASNIDSDPDVLNTLQISPSSLSHTIIGTGEAGNIDISASSVILASENENSSSISSSTYAQGGGIIQLNSDAISISNNSQIYTETKGNSHGGGIYVSTDTLHLHNGGNINTNTVAAGNAGKIIVETSDELIAYDSNSGIFSQGNINASGDVGNIGITGNIVSFSNGSRVDATNFGLGKNGKISIEAKQLSMAEETVIHGVDNKNSQLGNISVARLRINSNQPLNMIELPKITNNPTELTVSTCTPQQNRDIAVNTILNPISTEENLKFWRSPTQKVASQSLDRIYQQEAISNSFITEAKSWIFNSKGKVELVTHSCS